MRIHRSLPRPGFAALDVVLCAAVAVPLAAALYAFVRVTLGDYFFAVGTAVGSPLF